MIENQVIKFLSCREVYKLNSQDYQTKPNQPKTFKKIQKHIDLILIRLIKGFHAP